VRPFSWRARSLAGVLVIAAAVLAARPAPVRMTTARQKVWQADLRIQTFEVTALKKGGPLSARVVVVSESDDAARAVRLDILLPIGAGVLRLSPGCRPSTSSVAGLNARVTCDLGDLPVRGLREVQISTTAAAPNGHPRFAAFVASDTPDPEPSNNYAERAVP
jgi:hypothetical protein